MGHSFAASVSKSWNAIIIVFITSCRFYIALSASGDRFHHERNPSTEGLSLQDVVKSKLLMSKGEVSEQRRGPTAERSTLELRRPERDTPLYQSQRVIPADCNSLDTYLAIEAEELRKNIKDNRNRWIYSHANSEAVHHENSSTRYDFSLVGLTNTDIIWNATIFSPFHIAQSGEPSPIAVNVTTSVMMTDTIKVQLRKIYYVTSGNTSLCHQMTPSAEVQLLLRAGSEILSIDVTMTCQFLSTNEESTSCSINRTQSPLLAIYLRRVTQPSTTESGGSTHSPQPQETQRVTPGLCDPNQTTLAIDEWLLSENSATDSSIRWILVAPDQDNTDERSALYHFSLYDLTIDDSILNATVFTPFFMTTSEAQSLAAFTPRNITLTITAIEKDGTERQVQQTTSHYPTYFCLQGTLSDVVQQTLQTDSRNLTFDVTTACQFLSGSPLESTNCSVDHLGRPFLVVFYRKLTPPENQRVTSGLCNRSETALAIDNWLLSENRPTNRSLKWIFLAPEEDASENAAHYHFNLYSLAMNDTILNATVFTPFSLATPQTLTISVIVTDVNIPQNQIQFTKVYEANSDFCHLGTMTQIVQQLVETGGRNLTVDVRTSCQLSSDEDQGTGCSINHDEGPFLAINYFTSRPIDTFPWDKIWS